VGVAILALTYGEPLLAFVPATVVAVAAALLTLRIGLSLGHGVATPGRTQAAIGALIRALILFQAACLFLLPASPWWALGLLLAWPVARLVGRRFYGS